MQTSKSHLRLRALCEGAIMVALAQALGYLKLWEMPWGGAISLCTLPIFIYCMRWGFGPSMLVSIALGFLQLLGDGAFAISWQAILGDFLIPYGILGVAGAFWRCKHAFYWGTIVANTLRFLSHYVVGATFWASTMPEQFFGMTMTSPWFYSFLYNGSYLALDLVLVLLVGTLLRKPMGAWMHPVHTLSPAK